MKSLRVEIELRHVLYARAVPVGGAKQREAETPQAWIAWCVRKLLPQVASAMVFTVLYLITNRVSSACGYKITSRYAAPGNKLPTFLSDG